MRKYTRQHYARLLRDYGISEEAETDLGPKEFGGKDIKLDTLKELVDLFKAPKDDVDNKIISNLIKYLNARTYISRCLSPEGILEIFTRNDIYFYLKNKQILEKNIDPSVLNKVLKEELVDSKGCRSFDRDLRQAIDKNPWFYFPALLFTKQYSSTEKAFKVLKKLPADYMDDELFEEFYNSGKNYKEEIGKETSKEFKQFFNTHQPAEYDEIHFHQIFKKIRDKLLEGASFIPVKDNCFFSKYMFKNRDTALSWAFEILKPHIFYAEPAPKKSS